MTLPVAQFPQIAPPEIRLQANYPGADAQTLEQSVDMPIEQQVSGVDNMTYMYSLNATANQQTTLIVDFDLKTDPNTDLVAHAIAPATGKWSVAARGEQLRNHAEEVDHCSAHDDRPILAAWHS